MSADIVLVASGTYVENINFLGKAITIRNAQGPDVTIIDGNHAESAVTFTGGETEATVLDGFTVRNGYSFANGGGIICDDSSPTITNCTISGNSAYSGGGIYCGSSFSTIINCTISGSSAIGSPLSGGFGGGICLYDSFPMFTHCTITENSADIGGGIWCEKTSLIITNCILWGDVAFHYGQEIDGPAIAFYSDIEGGWPGSGIIDSNPLFIGGGNYHLTAGSPCVDAGEYVAGGCS